MCKFFQNTSKKELESARATIAQQQITIVDLQTDKSILSAANRKLRQQLVPPAPAKVLGQITGTQLYALIQESFPQMDLRDVDLADSEYDYTTFAEMARFLEHDQTDKIEWMKHSPDCDDFTRRLLGNLTVPGWYKIVKGDIWIEYDSGGGHSILITVLCDSEDDITPKLYMVEGQTDVVELATEMFEAFSVRLIKI